MLHKKYGIGNVSVYQLLIKSSAPWQKEGAESNLLTGDIGGMASVTYRQVLAAAFNTLSIFEHWGTW